MSAVRTDTIRVTNVYQCDEKYVSFSGVPFPRQGWKKTDKKRLVFVKTVSTKVAIEPTIGQHWKVSGYAEKRIGTYTNKLQREETHYIRPESLELKIPNSIDRFALFVMKEPSFKGVTEDDAISLWEKFGKQVYQLADSEDEVELSKVISLNKTIKLIKGLKKYANLKYSTWFSELNIPVHIQQRLLRYHAEKSVDLLKENPYHLTTVGMKFQDVDRIARKSFYVEKTDTRRLISAFQQAIQQHENNGHTIAYGSDLIKRLKGEKLLNCERLASQAFSIVKEATANKVFVYNQQHKTFQSTATYIKEKSIALRIKHLATMELNESEKTKVKVAFRYALKSVPLKLTLGQCRAIYKALTNNICIVTGGAGTGKTTVLKAILAGYEVLGIRFHCAALSGKAAKRMNESTGQPSKTIAKLLMGEPISPFLLDDSNNNALVIDEASMIDVSTMFKLINHIHPDTRVLLIGDPKQLPPIEYGLVLNDLIKSNAVTISRLNIVKRSDENTGIAEYAANVANGVIPPLLSSGKVYFHNVAEKDINQKCVELYKESISNSTITSAVYRKDMGGINILNKLTQEQVNSKAKNLQYKYDSQIVNLPIKLGDPVIFTKNDTKAGVQNGAMGKLVTLPTKKHLGEVLIEGTDEVVQLNSDLIKTLEPAYALCLHKAQGSQFKRTIVSICSTHHMINRNWLYTAISRAEEEVHLVGPQSYLEQGILRKGDIDKRKTGLGYILNSLF